MRFSTTALVGLYAYIFSSCGTDSTRSSTASKPTETSREESPSPSPPASTADPSIHPEFHRARSVNASNGELVCVPWILFRDETPELSETDFFVSALAAREREGSVALATALRQSYVLRFTTTGELPAKWAPEWALELPSRLGVAQLITLDAHTLLVLPTYETHLYVLQLDRKGQPRRISQCPSATHAFASRLGRFEQSTTAGVLLSRATDPRPIQTTLSEDPKGLRLRWADLAPPLVQRSWDASTSRRNASIALDQFGSRTRLYYRNEAASFAEVTVLEGARTALVHDDSFVVGLSSRPDRLESILVEPLTTFPSWAPTKLEIPAGSDHINSLATRRRGKGKSPQLVAFGLEADSLLVLQAGPMFVRLPLNKNPTTAPAQARLAGGVAVDIDGDGDDELVVTPRVGHDASLAVISLDSKNATFHEVGVRASPQTRLFRAHPADEEDPRP